MAIENTSPIEDLTKSVEENSDTDNTNLPNFDVEALKHFQKSPFAFIEASLGEVPQPIKPEYKEYVLALYTIPAHQFSDYADTIRAEMFEPFEKGKHLTWQQAVAIIAVQRAVNGSLPPRIAIKAGRGTGKAIDKNEIVWLNNKNNTIPVKAKDVKVGDTILGKNKPTKVIAIANQPRMKMYKVTLDDGSALVVNGAHLFTVSDGQIRKKLNKRVGYDKNSEEGKWETIDVNEMIVRGTRLWNKNPERRFRLPIQSVKGSKKVADAYTVGVWYGDGTRNTSHYTKPDDFIAYKIGTNGYSVSTPQNDRGRRNVKLLKKRLNELGVPVTTKEHLPSNFLTWDFESRVELLRGLMDTDGYCEKLGHAEFSTSISSLADDVALLIRSLGGKTSIRVKEKTFYNDDDGNRVYCKPSYRLTVSTTFNPFSLPRKAERYKTPTQDRYLYRFVDTIEYLRDDESVCFEVDAEDNLFLAGEGMIATHNSSLMSRLILWFLFSFPLSKIPCTAPTADQLFAVLWSEINLVLSMMKPEFAEMFEWETKFVRVKEHSQVWYARAKTSSKGETGSLSGIHSDFMASFADESYDIEDEVFHVAEATQTGDKSLMVLVGNAVYDHGYFYDCFNKNADGWIRITMNAEESPIVNQSLIESQRKMYGVKSNHYRASILGEFPIASAIDVDGWYRLFSDDWINEVMVSDEDDKYQQLFEDNAFRRQESFLGVDPSGEGTDEAVGYIRNMSAAKLVFHNEHASIRGTALSVIGTIETYAMNGQYDVVCDNFGVGAELSQEVMIQSNSQYVIDGRNVGDKPEDILDQSVYLNERARMYDALYWWGKRGGKILYDDVLAEELKTIFVRKSETGKKQIMPKREMRKRGYRSPNRCDALAQTTLNDRMLSNYIPRAEFKAVFTPSPQRDRHDPKPKEVFDKFSGVPSLD